MPTSNAYRTAAAAAVALGSIPLFGAAAGAQTCYPPTPGCVTTTTSGGTGGPTLTLSDTTVTRSQTIGATVGGFDPGTTGILTIASVEQQIGSFTMPATGTTTSSITIPSTISLGAHTVFARGTFRGQPASVSQGVTVIAGGVLGTGQDDDGAGTSGGKLARTGATLGLVTIIGLGLVAGGLAMKRSSRRGKASKPA